VNPMTARLCERDIRRVSRGQRNLPGRSKMGRDELARTLGYK